MTLSEKLQRLRSEFADVQDPQERLSLVVERARRAPSLDSSERTERFRVPGCISPVWLVPEIHEGKCILRGDAHGPVVRGLVIFLCSFYNCASPEGILRCADDPLETVGIVSQLSPTRRNGLLAFREAIRNFAQAAANARRGSPGAK